MQQLRLSRALVVAAAVVWALAAGSASAQSFTGNRPTNLAGVTTSAVPPGGFDALRATDAALSAYGFPPRPSPAFAPNAYVNWANAVGTSPQRVTPQLVQTEVYHGARKGGISARVAQSSAVTSTNWSGYAVDTGATQWSGSSFTTIAGDFIVPAVSTHTCNNAWEYSAEWVGIDGYSSNDVLQAGIEADAICSNNTTQTYYAPWYEWYPNASIRITNLTAAPGQSFYVHVWATASNAGHAYLQNLSTNQSVSLNFAPPSGTTLRGESAEWIVESPSVNGVLAKLPHYALDYFSAGTSTTLGNATQTPGSTSAIAISLSVSGTIYSTPTLLGTGGVLFTSD